jgi:hypothetical protein
MALNKLYARWADPTRPVLLPLDTMVGRLAELSAVRRWTQENVELLLDVANDMINASLNPPYNLTQLVYMVEVDYWTWGVDDAICKRLVRATKNCYFRF